MIFGNRLAWKWTILAAGALAALGAVLFVRWARSPRREFERSRAAIAAATSWHMHTVRVFSNIAPEMVDVDVVCPGFEHRTAEEARADGTLASVDSIKYNGHTYNRAAGQWVEAQAPASDFWNCDNHGTLLDGDGNSLPYSAILSDGMIQRGGLVQAGEETCRDFEVVVPTPTNILERNYRFFICLNEKDHLPRETRRTPRGSDHEDVIFYSHWNEYMQPSLPFDFPK
jgi:hypothetical protein